MRSVPLEVTALAFARQHDSDFSTRTELHKSTGDLNEICELFRAAVEGIDSKTYHEIPELPEAAVAKVSMSAISR